MGALLQTLLVGQAVDLPNLAWAQTVGGPAHVTRAVHVYLQREQAVLDALRRHDAAALTSLVGEEFQLVPGRDSASPVPRDEWITAMQRPSATSYEVVDMAVRELGPVAIVSFTLKPQPGSVPVMSPEVFVVDVWEGAGTQWQLTARHASPIVPGAPIVPGDTAAPRFRKRP